MVRDRELEEMPGNPFVPQNRPRIFNRGPDVKVLRIRVVGWDEIEAGRIFIINARRIHESARAGRLERFGQLPDFELAEISRQSHEMMILEELDHLRLATLISLQERRLVGRNVFTPLRIGIG